MSQKLMPEIDSTICECEPITNEPFEFKPMKFYFLRADFSPYRFVFQWDVNFTMQNINRYNLFELKRNIEIITSFLTFRRNWNDNGAPPFIERLIELAIEVVRTLDYQPQVFPTARKSILLEYEKPEGKYLGIEVFSNRIEAFKQPQGEIVSLIPSDLERLREIVNEFNT